VPYLHEPLYALKWLAAGSLLTRHVNVSVNRFGHCNFTAAEALISFAIMLFYDGLLEGITGTPSFMTSSDRARFERSARASGLPHRRTPGALTFNIQTAK
jgi:hypothetical protein